MRKSKTNHRVRGGGWWARAGGAHLKHTVHTTALQASLRALFLELGTYTCTKARPLLSVTVLYAYYKAFACKMHYKYDLRYPARKVTKLERGL